MKRGCSSCGPYTAAYAVLSPILNIALPSACGMTPALAVIGLVSFHFLPSCLLISFAILFYLVASYFCEEVLDFLC